jgi:AcrR family transcriptional regulator
VQPKQKVIPQIPEISKRKERANRILDAASTLILRWGYNKINIEDIARQAGVGKGTIYMHWKTRAELFQALYRRESMEMAADYTRHIREDPASATLHGLYKYYILTLVRRPLLKRLLLRDQEMAGKFALGEHGNAAFLERLDGLKTYLEFLRQEGLVRTDNTVREQVYMLSAIVMGFYLVAPWMPKDLTLTDEEIAGLIAETLQRTLESDRVPSPEELQKVSHTLVEYLTKSLALYEAEFQQELDSEE